MSILAAKAFLSRMVGIIIVIFDKKLKILAFFYIKVIYPV